MEVKVDETTITMFRVGLLDVGRAGPRVAVVAGKLGSTGKVLFATFSTGPIPFVTEPETGPPTAVRVATRSVSFESLTIAAPMGTGATVKDVTAILTLAPDYLPRAREEVMEGGITPAAVMHRL